MWNILYINKKFILLLFFFQSIASKQYNQEKHMKWCQQTIRELFKTKQDLQEENKELRNMLKKIHQTINISNNPEEERLTVQRIKTILNKNE